MNKKELRKAITSAVAKWGVDCDVECGRSAMRSVRRMRGYERDRWGHERLEIRENGRALTLWVRENATIDPDGIRVHPDIPMGESEEPESVQE